MNVYRLTIILSFQLPIQRLRLTRLNKNSKDFDDPDISEMLEKYKCKMLTRFDHGHQYIINRIR
jgi:hypothetical protein